MIGTRFESKVGQSVLLNGSLNMNKELEVNDYCDDCGCIQRLYRQKHPGVIQWICSECGAVVDSDYDRYDNYGDEDYD